MEFRRKLYNFWYKNKETIRDWFLGLFFTYIILAGIFGAITLLSYGILLSELGSPPKEYRKVKEEFVKIDPKTEPSLICHWKPNNGFFFLVKVIQLPSSTLACALFETDKRKEEAKRREREGEDIYTKQFYHKKENTKEVK